MNKTQELYEHAKRVIPGGGQLLSKRPEMFAPGQWPAYAVKADGCEVWDLDGNKYYDMTTNGVGSCLLGYNDADVTKAVVDRIENGSMSSLNAPEEVYLADKLIEIHPWAESVRFARTGGDSCAVAVRIARATTGRDIVVLCGYHGWTDWYLAANLSSNHELDGVHLPGLDPTGVPKSLTGTTLTFNFGDKEKLDNIISEYGDRIACIVMEPLRHEEPDPEFLQYVKDSVNKAGGLLVYDEITIGWRYTFGGSHRKFGVNPDIAVFAKAMGNGHPIGAIVGTKAAMDGAEVSFISSTYWTEAVGPTAALATIDKMEKTRVWEHAAKIGTMVQNSWKDNAKKHGLNITCEGIPCLATFGFKDFSLECKTLYTVLMLKEGFLGSPALYPTLVHTEEIVEKYNQAIDKVFGIISEQIKKGGAEAVKEAIGGPVCKSGFARLLK